MIRPFTLLYLADLHIGQNGNAATIFEKLQVKIKDDFVTKNPQFQPDFLVIAGDVIDSSRKAEKYRKKYKEARETVKSLCKMFSIKKNHVIIVPGNHDKCSGKTSTEMIEAFNKFYNKHSSEIVNDSHWNDFNDLYSGYRKFYQQYLNPKGVKYFCDNVLYKKVPDGISSGSGLIVFKSLNVCFLLINTEWTYQPENANKDNKCLIPVLIGKPLQEYYHRYSGYTLITVMHRSPQDLSWEEKYGGDGESDVLRDIYDASDIIVSGHMHAENFMPPHMMANHAQLVNLGSVSHGNGEVKHLRASLMIVDQLQTQFDIRTYEMNRNSFEWFLKNSDTYPLCNRLFKKHISSAQEIFPFPVNGVLRTFSKSSNKEDVEESINLLFRGQKTLKWNAADPLTIDTPPKNRVIVAIYALLSCSDVRNNQDEGILLEKMMSLENNLRERYWEKYFSAELIIQKVLINYPLRQSYM